MTNRNGWWMKILGIVVAGLVLTGLIGAIASWGDTKVQANTVAQHERRLTKVEVGIDTIKDDVGEIKVSIKGIAGDSEKNTERFVEIQRRLTSMENK